MSDSKTDENPTPNIQKQTALSIDLLELERLEQAAQLVLDFVRKYRLQLNNTSSPNAQGQDKLDPIKQQFCLTLAENFKPLQEGVDSQDWKEVARRANQISGDAGLYGLEDLSCFARQLEDFAMQQDLDGAIRSLAELERALVQG